METKKTGKSTGIPAWIMSLIVAALSIVMCSGRVLSVISSIVGARIGLRIIIKANPGTPVI
jgi:hypothetical protein